MDLIEHLSQILLELYLIKIFKFFLHQNLKIKEIFLMTSNLKNYLLNLFKFYKINRLQSF